MNGRRLGLLLLMVAIVTAACGADLAAEPTPVSSSTSSTSTTSTTPPTSSTTTSTTSTTSTTTTSTTTTTTTLPSTLEIEGSPMIELSIEVDEELLGELNQDELVAFVIETLSDPRSWTSRGAGFRLVDEGGLFTITVASPDRVDQLCYPLQTIGRYSCARNGWIAFNSERWFNATDDWPADIDTYRRYLINHEVGHYILGGGHPGCPGVGEPAPVMMQQTKGLHGCEPNGWVVSDQ